MTKTQERDFAARLKAWRDAHGFDQAKAAKELDVSLRTLQEWEQRRRRPLLESVVHVLERLVRDGF